MTKDPCRELVNHQRNPLEAVKDLSSGDSLRSLATTILSAGLTKGICNILELLIDIGVEKTPLEHIEVAAIRARVNGTLNKLANGSEIIISIRSPIKYRMPF